MFAVIFYLAEVGGRKLSKSVDFGYLVLVTLRETNTFAPENGWLQDEISFSEGTCSGAMLV